MPTPKLLTIIGNIGSGKSTAMPILLDSLEAHPVHADDLFQTTDPFRDDYLNDLKRWSFTNELWLTFERSRLIKEHASPKHKMTIIDSGLLMSWVYTYSHLLVGNITLAEWEFYTRLFDHLAGDLFSQSVVIRLEYSVDTLMSRITKRGREYELQFYTREYLEQIEQGLVALDKKLQGLGVTVVTINESELPDFEASAKGKQTLINLVKENIKTS